MFLLHTKGEGQPGLEGILIETYYLADTFDSGTSFFPVPHNALTYRVFVDMASGWELQAIFGSTNTSTGEIDSLIIRSSEPFFNNEEYGSAFGYQIPTALLDENTVTLDSWFSTGRPGNSSRAVIKPHDTNGAAPSFPNQNGLLQNDHPIAGIPIHISDGNIPGASTATWSLIGINLADLFMFENTNLAGNEFITIDGALTCFSPSLQGPDQENRVLIGQFTTAGTFSGQLNVQLRNTSSDEIQQWVAESPGIEQFTLPSLKWVHNELPTINITSPLNGTKYSSGQTVEVYADAFDSDGSVVDVQFYFNGSSIGVDDTAPYEISFPASSIGIITAVVTDNLGGQSVSSPVHIEVNPYRIRNIEQLCNFEIVCMPVEVFGEGIYNITGFDLMIGFDHSKVIPTGSIIKSNDLVNRNYFNTHHTIDLTNQRMLISVNLNSNAPDSTVFSGSGDIICIEFAKRPAFDADDTTEIELLSLQETFLSGEMIQRDSLPSGTFASYRNSILLGSLAFWEDNRPMKYDTLNPNEYPITNITGSTGGCMLSGIAVQPDLDGAFIHDVNTGNHLSIDRDIEGTTDMQAVINSFDAFLVRKVLTDNPDFIPSVFQMIAMDVNHDGVISAGDLSQINQRSLLIIDEFRQIWNYNTDGTPKPDYAPSKDWSFVGQNTILLDPAYALSGKYPDDNGQGYSRHRVPQLPFCVWTGINSNPDECPEGGAEIFYGILLGDVNGNYQN